MRTAKRTIRLESKTLRSFSLPASLVLAALVATASPSFAGLDVWTSGGPDGGPVTSLAADPRDPLVVYATTFQGAYKTTDGGASWTPLAGLNVFGDAGLLAVDPTNSFTLWADVSVLSGGSLRSRIFRSPDAGSTWRLVADLQSLANTFVSAKEIVVDPTNSSIVYVGTTGGIFKTADGGMTWGRVTNGIPKSCYTLSGTLICSEASIRYLAIDPNDPATLYVVPLLVGTPDQVFVTHDAAASWQLLVALPDRSTWWTGLVVDRSSRLFLLNGSVVDTVWGGSPPAPICTSENQNSTLALDASGNDLYLLTTIGGGWLVKRSTDGGRNWSSIRGLLQLAPNVDRLVISSDGRFLHAGMSQYDGGVFDLEVVSPPRRDDDLLVPIVLDVAAGTARYTTELTLTNDTPAPQPLELTYTASIGARAGSGSVTHVLGAGEQFRIPDAIGFLKSKGLPIPVPGDFPAEGGSLLIRTPGRTEGRVGVLARTGSATVAPLPVGRAGLAYGSTTTTPGHPRFTVWGLRSDAKDRSNLAVVNDSGEDLRYTITVFSGSGDGRSVVVRDLATLPPWGWAQVNSDELLDANGISNGWAVVETPSPAGQITGYGVINDRVTNDGSFLFPSFTASSGEIIPAVVESTAFRSEIFISNPEAKDVRVLLSGDAVYTDIVVPARTQLIIPEIVDFLRRQTGKVGPPGPTYAFALAFWTRFDSDPYGTPAVHMGVRTAAPATTAGGSFGLCMPGMELIRSATDRAYVYGLVADEANRSNVAVVFAWQTAAQSVTLRLQVHDGDAGGAAKGELLTVEFTDTGWKQFDGILKSAGVRNGWVEITHVSGDGWWGAYGVINDGGNPGERTGDGAYVPMVVAR
jgi:photosystem II stability/assembly factor-like uncharacterized protein